MRLDLLEQRLDELYADGALVAFVIATFGTTDAYGIDDIKAIDEIVTRKANEHQATRPHLHVDAAVGWVSCFLTDYDLDANPMECGEKTLALIKKKPGNGNRFSPRRFGHNRFPQNGLGALSIERLHREETRRLWPIDPHFGGYPLFLRSRFPARSSPVHA